MGGIGNQVSATREADKPAGAVRQVLRVASASIVALIINGGLLVLFLLVYWEVGKGQTFRSGVLAQSLHGPVFAVFQAVLYAILALSLALTVATSIALARLLRVRVRVALLLTLFLLGMAALPFLGFVSLENDCTLGRAFPFPGADCGT